MLKWKPTGKTQRKENTRADATSLTTFIKLFMILVGDNYKESMASCPISKASIGGFSYSFLVFSFVIFPGDISEIFFLCYFEKS